MQFSKIAAVAGFVAVANAQSACVTAAEAIPPCALGVIAEAAYSSYSCDIIDFACQCSNFDALQGQVAGPIASIPGCDVGSVLGPASSLCSCATANAGQDLSLNALQSSCQPLAVTIPACALGYIADAAATIGSCALQDFECQCSNFQAIEQSVAGQLASACGASVGAVIQSASSLCACVSQGSGGGSGTGSGSAGPTTSGGSAPTGSSGGSGSGSMSMAAPTGGSGSGGSGGAGMSTYTGAAPTAAAFGGVVGLVAGLAALL